MPRLPVLLLLALAPALAGCGKRGPLDPPPGLAPSPRAESPASPPAEAAPVAPSTPSLLRSTAGKPELPEVAARPTPLRPRPFILDPLL